ncbi:energy-coupling factor ABC transporter ATP-binding protein [Bhargavaea ullalensis]|uniref:Energy-coupling factor transport system ATP-binding protein n=1 Tax=Bhargavaea ullalensis TaxID=1265685 RepID=A0ABV2G8B3_9BACL
MERILSMEDIRFTYTPDEPDQPYAVDGVSLGMQQGEWIAVVGHNGSGKSTLARLMIGLLFPQEGTVGLFGDTLTEENLWDKRSQMGMVFQNPDNQFVGATVQDDVAFALENNGIPFKEMTVRVQEALAQVKMDGFMDHEPQHLSGGQKQRVAIAGALALKPRLLILDEATSMLDPQGREEVIKVILELREKTGLSVISITHDLEEALLADRIIVMNRGRKFAEGTPAEVFAKGEELTALGLDLPFAARMTALLRDRGLPLRETMSERKLVESLWTSRSNG